MRSKREKRNYKISITQNGYKIPSTAKLCWGLTTCQPLGGHFVSSPREREKRDSRGDEREGQGRKRNRNEKKSEEIKTFPPIPLPATRLAGQN